MNNLCHTIINCSENSFWLFFCVFFIYHTFLKLSDFKHKQKSSLKIIVNKVFYFFEHFIPLTQFCEPTLSDNFWATGYVFHQARIFFSNYDFWEILTIHSKKHLKINFGSKIKFGIKKHFCVKKGRINNCTDFYSAYQTCCFRGERG